MLFNILCFIHVILCIMIILLVLLQHGKGADAGAIMGSGAEAMLGAGNAGNIISRITTSAAIAFMVTSILIARFYQSPADNRPVEIKALEGSVVANDEDEEPLQLPVFPENDAASDEVKTESDDASSVETKAAEEVQEVKEEATAAETVQEVKEEAAAVETVQEVKEEAKAEATLEVKEETAAVESDTQENIKIDSKESAAEVAE